MLTLKMFVNNSIITTRKLCIAISLLLIAMFDQTFGYALLEGSNCKLDNNNFGVCVKITECTTVLNALKSGRMGFNDLIQCSFVGNIQVICCGDRMPTVTSQKIISSTQIPDQIIFVSDMWLTTTTNNVVEKTTQKSIIFDDYDKNLVDAIFNINNENNKNNNLPSVTTTEPLLKNHQNSRPSFSDSNSINQASKTIDIATNLASIGPDKWMTEALAKTNEQKGRKDDNPDWNYSPSTESSSQLSLTKSPTFTDQWILIALKLKGNNGQEFSNNLVQNNNNNLNWNQQQQEHIELNKQLSQQQQQVSSKFNFENNPFLTKTISTSQSPLLTTNIQLPLLDPWMVDALTSISTTDTIASFHGNTHHTHESMKIPTWNFNRDKDNEIIASKTTTGQTTNVSPVSRIGRKADIACEQYTSLAGPSLTFHILDGLPTTPGEFPHMVALGYNVIETSTENIEWNCGGSLISEKFVLTAAHCVPERRRPVVVRLGTNNLNSVSDFVDSGISDIIPHPIYKPNEQYNDIALIRLEKTVEFNFYIRPACLNTNLSEITSNERLLATGWGIVSLKTKKKSRVLLQANLTSVDLSACNESFVNYGLSRRIRHGIEAAQLCAHDPELRRDTCEGDSGGPLQIKTSQSSYIIVGVTSFGLLCGSTIPGVYAKVSHYLEWIENIVW